MKKESKAHETQSHTAEQLAGLFFQAFAQLDMHKMEELYDEYILALSKRNGDYGAFLHALRRKLINCFSDLSLLSVDTCEDYCLLAQRINKMLPTMKFETHQCYQFLHSAKEGAEGLKRLASYVEQLKQHSHWTNLDELPFFLEFDYIYPNGRQGDILKYIFEEYGENIQREGLVWHGKIEKKHIILLDVLYPVSDSCGYSVKVLSEDLCFEEIFEHHIPTIIDNHLRDLVYKKANWFQEFRDFQAQVRSYREEQIQKRNEIYSQLILQGKASPKWKSEAQLYALVSSIYPDAIYQYRAIWLQPQSIDIYIPSLNIGIEYQGKQHYEPIEHFGGEEHLRRQQENDLKKKILCSSNGVNLIEWPYTENITESNLIKALSIINT